MVWLRKYALPYIDLILFLVIIAFALGLFSDNLNSSNAEVRAILIGALFGGAALLLGNWINRWNEAAKARGDIDERISKVKTLIAAQLVYLAVHLKPLKEVADAGFVQVRSGGGKIPATDLAKLLPERLSIVRDLGSDLMVLDKAAIDALVTLESNLSITRAKLTSLAAARADIGWLGLTPIVSGIGMDMEVLAECFEHIAPEREYRFDTDKELFATFLRRAAPLPKDDADH